MPARGQRGAGAGPARGRRGASAGQVVLEHHPWRRHFVGHGKTFATQILKPKCRIGVPSYQDEGIPRRAGT